MPVAKSLAKMSVAELEAKYSTKAKDGKITTQGDKYFVTVDGKKSELKPNLIFTPQPLGKMLEKTAAARVIMSRAGDIVVVIIDAARFRCYHILCYIVASPVIPVIDAQLRLDAIKKLVKDEAIPKTLASQLAKEIKAGLAKEVIR